MRDLPRRDLWGDRSLTTGNPLPRWWASIHNIMHVSQPADFVRLEKPLASAIEHFQKALELPPPYGHPEEGVLAVEISGGTKSLVDEDYIKARMADIREIQDIITSQ